jgi:hypothetical protein
MTVRNSYIFLLTLSLVFLLSTLPIPFMVKSLSFLLIVVILYKFNNVFFHFISLHTKRIALMLSVLAFLNLLGLFALYFFENKNILLLHVALESEPPRKTGNLWGAYSSILGWRNVLFAVEVLLIVNLGYFLSRLKLK